MLRQPIEQIALRNAQRKDHRGHSVTGGIVWILLPIPASSSGCTGKGVHLQLWDSGSQLLSSRPDKRDASSDIGRTSFASRNFSSTGTGKCTKSGECGCSGTEHQRLLL